MVSNRNPYNYKSVEKHCRAHSILQKVIINGRCSNQKETLHSDASFIVRNWYTLYMYGLDA